MSRSVAAWRRSGAVTPLLPQTRLSGRLCAFNSCTAWLRSGSRQPPPARPPLAAAAAMAAAARLLHACMQHLCAAPKTPSRPPCLCPGLHSPSLPLRSCPPAAGGGAQQPSRHLSSHPACTPSLPQHACPRHPVIASKHPPASAVCSSAMPPITCMPACSLHFVCRRALGAAAAPDRTGASSCKRLRDAGLGSAPQLGSASSWAHP